MSMLAGHRGSAGRNHLSYFGFSGTSRGFLVRGSNYCCSGFLRGYHNTDVST